MICFLLLLTFVFRKGENVSTAEVGHVLSGCSGVSDVSVYGVEVPKCDGRAGMAIITLTDGLPLHNFDWQSLQRTCEANLPIYARPLFIRVQKEIKTTGSFKHIKGESVKEGFDPQKCSGDPLFFNHSKEKKFIPLTAEVYKDIVSGKYQL